MHGRIPHHAPPSPSSSLEFDSASILLPLQIKTLKIFDFKGLIGKIFWNKELAWLPASSTRPHCCSPPEINHLAEVFSRGLLVRFQNIERKGVIRKTPDKRIEDVGH